MKMLHEHDFSRCGSWFGIGWVVPLCGTAMGTADDKEGGADAYGSAKMQAILRSCTMMISRLVDRLQCSTAVWSPLLIELRTTRVPGCRTWCRVAVLTVTVTELYE